MVNRRTVLKNGIAIGAAGLVGLGASGSTGVVAQTTAEEELLVNEFGDGYPGSNRVGEWSEHVAFANDDVAGGALRLEYDDGGFFATNLFEDLSAYETLEIVVSGDDGDEETDIDLRIGDVRDRLSNLTDDSIGTTASTVTVDLEAAGVDRSSVNQLRLAFWHGASGAIELEEVAFVGAGDEGPPQEVTPDMTILEYFPEFQREGVEHGVRLDEYLPGEIDEGEGHGDHEQVNWPDAQKADHFDVDLEAIRDGADGTVTFGEMGDVVLDHVNAYEAEGVSRETVVKLLPRLIFLPHETETPTYHNQPMNWWEETAGPVAATNDPDQLLQDPWPPDARNYRPEEVAIRDRAHDQPEHESDEEWTQNDRLAEGRYRNEDNPIHLLAEGLHPVTEEPLGGDGFTANAPMEVEAKVHDEGGFWYQVLEFLNTSDVPYYLNAAVVMWIGPSGGNAGNLRAGHYNNEQRPQPGWGHPQRDIIEVLHDEERQLSAWAVRLAFHDEPYNMRTAYPNQHWSLEQGLPANDHFDDAETRQKLVDTMVDTCHVEIETDMDRNDALLDALNLRNRMSN